MNTTNDAGTKTAGQQRRGRPFTGANDPRINRRGRPPKELAIAPMLRDIAGETDPGTKRTRLEELLRKVFENALAGQSWAVNFIAERLEGRVQDRVAIEDERNNAAGPLVMVLARSAIRAMQPPPQ